MKQLLTLLGILCCTILNAQKIELKKLNTKTK